MRDILVGTLVIDMADAKKGQLVWRGMGVKEVNTQAKPEKRDKSINKAVNKIFKNYPPKVEVVGRDGPDDCDSPCNWCRPRADDGGESAAHRPPRPASSRPRR